MRTSSPLPNSPPVPSHPSPLSPNSKPWDLNHYGGGTAERWKVMLRWKKWPFSYTSGHVVCSLCVSLFSSIKIIVPTTWSVFRITWENMCKSVRTHLAYQKASVHVRFSNTIDGQVMRGLINTGNLQYFLRGAGGTWSHRPWAYTDQETPGCLGENWKDIKGQSHPLHICLRQALDASITCEERVAPRYLTKLFSKNQQQGVLRAAFFNC